MSRRPFIPLREPVFVGCEGQSEAGYARLLSDFVRDADLPYHLTIEELAPGAGDPLARVIMAANKIDKLEARRARFAARFVILDHDQAEVEPGRAAQAIAMARREGISLVWQRPCFEAVLLRHLPGRSMNRPPQTAAAITALEREWPGYRKGLDRLELAERIDMDSVRRAAAVEDDLAELLRAIRLIE